MAKILSVLAVLLAVTVVRAQFEFSNLKIEAIRSGKVRVSMPHVNGAKLFAFHANVNEQIHDSETGTFYKETTSPDGNFWVMTFDMPIETGDVIYYWAYAIIHKIGFKKEDRWNVDFKTQFTSLSECIESVTVMNSEKTSCGQILLEDTFTGPQLNRSNWIVHHKIPTYTGPNFEFNSYLDQDETRFFKNDKLYIKPIPFKNAEDVRGTLNLTEKCTSSIPKECLYVQRSSFILPPVRSAKLTSKLSFKYGRIEIKAKLPKGDWIVPIMELEDRQQSDGVNSAKVWIAYTRGNRVLKGNGPDDYGSRLLFGGPVVYPTEPLRSKYLASKYGPKPYNDDYHVYAMEWRPGKMVFYVDDEVFGDISTKKGFAEHSIQVRGDWTVPEAPYNKEYVLSLGVAVGGIYDFPDGFNSENDPKPWINTERNYIHRFFEARDTWMQTWHRDDVALQIAYVKVTAI